MSQRKQLPSPIAKMHTSVGKPPPALPGSETPGAVKQARARLEALPGLRFLAELQIIGFHYYTNTSSPWVNNFNAWGNCPLTFFFILSGFIFGYIYGGRDPSHRISWWDFMAKRFAGLYPLYFFSIIMGFSLASHHKPQPFSLFVVMALTASKALPSAFWNPISAPAWTVGAFFVLYAFLPYCLRMLRSATPFTRLYVLPPALFLASMAMPALDLGYNTGILHAYTRAIGICSVANFLQGLNLGLLYLDHDWDRHPRALQRFGATAVVLTIVLIAMVVEEKSMPRFMILWRDHGLFSPFYCLLIWYTARDRDVLCPLLKTRPVQFLGNISYGMYLFQQVVFNYLSQSSFFFQHHHYIQVYHLIPLIVVVAAFGVHVVQSNYTDPFYRWLRRQIATYVEKETSTIASVWELSMVLFALPLTKALTIALFVPTYIFFVNYQGCMPLKCSVPSWSTYAWPSGLADRFWMGDQDYNWAVNWWFLPCERRSFLPHGSKSLTTLITISVVTGLLACPALVTSYVLVWRSSILGKYLTSAASGLKVPAFIKRNMELATQEEMEARLTITGSTESSSVGYQSGITTTTAAKANSPVPSDVVEETKNDAAATASSPSSSTAQTSPSGSSSSTITTTTIPRVFVRVLVKAGSPKGAIDDNVWRHAKMLHDMASSSSSSSAKTRFVLEVLGHHPSLALQARLPAGTYHHHHQNDGADASAASTCSGSAKSLDAVTATSERLQVVFIHDGDDDKRPHQHQEQRHPSSSSSFAELVALARRASAATGRDGVIYLESNCRLDRAGMDECVDHLRASAGDQEVGVVNNLRVEGSDDVVPGLFTFSHFNVLDRRRNHASAPTIAVLHASTDTAADVPAPRIADAVELGLCQPDDVAPFTAVTLSRGMAFFRTLTWAHYSDTRIKVISAYIRRCGLRSHASTDVISELCMHAAFVTSTAVLLLSPIYKEYVDADYCKYGSGFDCSNGFGLGGNRFYRTLAALIAALYTGIYFHGFVTTFCPRDGLIRLAVLFFLMLLVLPLLAVLDGVITILGIMTSSWTGDVSSPSALIGGGVKSLFTFSTTEEVEMDGEFAPLMLEAEHMELGRPVAAEEAEEEMTVRRVDVWPVVI